jgi:predicted DNA-binding transcriptional regulator AlpA
MRREELDDLPPVVDVPTAGEILGVGRSCAYELVRSGQWPTPVLHLGRLIRIPTTPLVDLLSGRGGQSGVRDEAHSAAG